MNQAQAVVNKLVAKIFLVVAVILLVLSGALFYAHSFIHGTVHDQMAAEKIMFPAKGSAAMNELTGADKAAVEKYAGQQLTTGAQAEVFADHYIAVHLRKIGGGKTYSELSSESMAQPDNTALANQVNTVFKGEMLRGVLLNAYAFDTMAVLAGYAAWGALAVGVVLFGWGLARLRSADRHHRH